MDDFGKMISERDDESGIFKLSRCLGFHGSGKDGCLQLPI